MINLESNETSPVMTSPEQEPTPTALAITSSKSAGTTFDLSSTNRKSTGLAKENAMTELIKETKRRESD
jgi:hypothetical protein